MAVTYVGQDADLDALSQRFAATLIATRNGRFDSRDRVFARAFPDYLGSDLFGLYLLDGSMRPCGRLVSRPLEGFLQEYEAFRNRDPIFLHLIRQRRATDGVSLLGFEGWRRHPLARFLKTWDLHYSLQGAVSDGSRLVATLNFARREQHGPFTVHEIMALERLCKQISDRLRSERTASCASMADRPAVTISEARGIDDSHMFLSDETGTMLHYDAAALGIGPGLAVSHIQDAIARTIAAMTARGLGAMECDIRDAGDVILRLATLAIPESRCFLTMLSRVKPPLRGANDPAAALGPRTRSVVGLLVRGYSNKLISREMGISENTVKDHVRRIYRHFGVAGRAELTWILHGYV